jgi:hypothetical protein
LRLRPTASFDNDVRSDNAASASCSSSSSNISNDNDSKCSVVSSIEEDMIMDFDNAMINNDCNRSYDCKTPTTKNVDHDSHNNNQQQEHDE